VLTRREFIKLCLGAGAGFSLGSTVLPRLAEAITALERRPPVIWLEVQTCTGNFLSFLNTLNPRLQELIFEIIDLRYGNTMMAAEGEQAIRALEDVARDARGEYILVVDGAVPTKDGGIYGAIGHHPDGRLFTDLEAVETLGPGARYVVAAGSCAAFGGPYAANPNPTGAKPVSMVLDRQVINVPGCPIHPDWLVATLSHLLLYGVPDLDPYNRPTMIYGDTVHDNCPRRQYFENSIFAAHPGDSGCTYKIGCKGPVTFTDCPTRQWSGEHLSWPVEANTPCIGCVAPEFPDGMEPFFEQLPDVKLPGVTVTARTAAAVAGIVTAGGIGAHLVGSVLTGRLARNWVGKTETTKTNPGTGPGGEEKTLSKREARKDASWRGRRRPAGKLARGKDRNHHERVQSEREGEKE